MIRRIKAILEEAGYDVVMRDQEITRPNELVLLLDDVDVEVETTEDYYMIESFLIYWTTEEPWSVKIDIARIMHAISSGLDLSLFKFRKPEIDKLGTAYKVNLVCENKEVINVD